MKTANNARIRPLSTTQSQSDEQHQDDFDQLVRRATHGDRRALGAIAIALSPSLLEEAREVLGEDLAHEAGDVLQDFFLMILEGESRFVPAYGRAVPWMCGIIRSMARRRRADWERWWGVAEDP
jgi:DNA-directed RNA polymerase specialized sigma24 family protein